nr:RNA polymerase II [Lysinibacillus timonensis]
MKYAVSFFVVLLLVISGLLFFQFQVYSDKDEEVEGEYLYTQEIEIEYHGDSLDIRHHFSNLPNQIIEIKWPNHAINPDCFLESEQTCDRISDDKTKFNVGDVRNQSLSYVIPLDGGLRSRKLMKDLFVSLQNGKPTYTTVHISTDSQIAGQWITGLPLIGQQSLSLVNYVVFSGPGDVRELYWQGGDMKLQYSSDVVSIYSKSNVNSELKEQVNELQLLNDQHVAIVNSENLTGEQGERIIFLKDISFEGLYKSIIMSQTKSLYDLSESPTWINETVASFLSGNVSDKGKSAKIVNTLMTEMSDQQLEEWVLKLKELQGSKLTSAELDKRLSEIFGLYTEFFASNEDIEGVFPLLFTDNRKLIVNEQTTKEVELIYQDGLLYYSADSILNLLGYKVSEGSNGYYVTNNVRSFRFPENYQFYVFNQRRYDTISDPIITITNKKYIEESWLQRLFLVDIEKTDDEIIISPITVNNESGE